MIMIPISFPCKYTRTATASFLVHALSNLQIQQVLFYARKLLRVNERSSDSNLGRGYFLFF